MMKRDEQRIAIPASNISGEVRKHRKQVFTQLRKEDIYYDLYTLGAAGPMDVCAIQHKARQDCIGCGGKGRQELLRQAHQSA